MLKTTVERTLVVVAALLMCAAALPAAELYPIVEIESGYFFGASSDGKWIKADETANSIKDETTYRVYGLTQALGEAKGGKPKVKIDNILRVDLDGDAEEEVLISATNSLDKSGRVLMRSPAGSYSMVLV